MHLIADIVTFYFAKLRLSTNFVSLAIATKMVTAWSALYSKKDNSTCIIGPYFSLPLQYKIYQLPFKLKLAP